MVLSRISYDREGQEVRIKSRSSQRGDEVVLDILDFIARLSVQVPDPHERLVLYFGLYSNASRQRRVSGERDEQPAHETD